MKKWEYLVLKPYRVSKRMGAARELESAREFVERLDDVGAKGWELVMETDKAPALLIFKREEQQ